MAHLLPIDPISGALTNMRGSNDEVAERAAKAFLALTPTVTSVTGAPFLIHNPEGGTRADPSAGTLEKRIRHLTQETKTKSFHPEKTKWIGAIEQTVVGACSVFFHLQHDSHVFVRRYSCGTVHLVFARRVDRFASNLSLVTQFVYAPGGYQDFAKLEWRRR